MQNLKLPVGFVGTVKLGKLKAQLREVEDDLVKALAGISWYLMVQDFNFSFIWCLLFGKNVGMSSVT